MHFTTLNPHISLAGTRFAIPTTLVPWPAGSEPRLAGVSSFGVGGTNAHVILEEAPRLPAGASGADGNTPRILPLSAHAPGALRALAESWVGFLARPTAPIGDLPATFNRIRERGLKFVFATNNGTKTPEEYQQKLHELGVEVEPWQIVTSALGIAFMLAQKHR